MTSHFALSQVIRDSISIVIISGEQPISENGIVGKSHGRVEVLGYTHGGGIGRFSFL